MANSEEVGLFGDNAKTETEALTSEECDFKVKCRPCEEVGDTSAGEGLCVDCQEYLCQKCFDAHLLPKPCRNHLMLEKEEVNELESQLSKKCLRHEEELIKFYCILHEELCCYSCVTESHHSCNEMQYIPHDAQDLSYIQEYQQFEQQLKSVVETSKDVDENAKQNAETMESSHPEAFRMIKMAKRTFIEAFDKAEADLVEQARQMQTEGRKKLAKMAEKFTAVQEEVNTLHARIEEFQSTNQSATLYIEYLEQRDKRSPSLAYQMHQAKQESSEFKCQIQFVPNQETLDKLSRPETFGTLLQKPRNL